MPPNSTGRRLVLTSIGESHGRYVGAVLDGCPAGLPLAERDVQPMLDKRRPGRSPVSTQRKEDDIVDIVSGTFRGKTTGAPVTMLVRNKDQRSTDYDRTRALFRPGHADHTAHVKYGGHEDYRGSGRFSGRLTATHVMGGAVARKILGTIGTATNSYTRQIGHICMEKGFAPNMARSIYRNDVRCPDAATAAAMKQEIISAKRDGDSLGGIIESVTTGVPAGLGEPMFGSLESDLASAMFSIPSVKGVEFGSGFAGSALRGSQNNDPYVKRRGKVETLTNNSGGILGGISNGMPIVMRVAFKPASSIPRSQDTVDRSGRRAVLRVRGRHDPCVVPRAPPVVDALVSMVLADHALISGRIGPVLQ
ncbi:MAG: chorismate synthase [Nitrosopumilus sp.]|nr:chorismate synthase [Nitrosopumilus sp.]